MTTNQQQPTYPELYQHSIDLLYPLINLDDRLGQACDPLNLALKYGDQVTPAMLEQAMAAIAETQTMLDEFSQFVKSLHP